MPLPMIRFFYAIYQSSAVNSILHQLHLYNYPTLTKHRTQRIPLNPSIKLVNARCCSGRSTLTLNNKIFSKNFSFEILLVILWWHTFN